MDKSMSSARAELAKDFVIIICGLAIATSLSVIGLWDIVLKAIGNPTLAAFISGIFFTTSFTIAPASIALTHIANEAPLLMTAFWAALGAVIGDIIIFLFIRDRFADDLVKSFKPKFVKHIVSSFHLGFLKWLTPFLGALIIASPIPDEVGLALMGISRVRLYVLIPVAFFMNFLGVYFIVWLSHGI